MSPILDNKNYFEETVSLQNELIVKLQKRLLYAMQTTEIMINVYHKEKNFYKDEICRLEKLKMPIDEDLIKRNLKIKYGEKITNKKEKKQSTLEEQKLEDNLLNDNDDKNIIDIFNNI